MKSWALRATETGLYLPWGRSNRGNSMVEFTSIDRPRLFNSKRAAINTLTSWRFGKWRWSGHGENTSLEPSGYKCEYRLKLKIEVVEFELAEVKNK